MFRVGELNFAVISSSVREVTRMGPMTPLPRAPAFVLGVVPHRGEVIPVVDMLRFLGQGEFKPSPRARLFIGLSGSWVVGFLADVVVGLRRIFIADKLPLPASQGLNAEFLAGVVQSREFGTLSLLDLARVMTAARQKVVAR